MYSSLKRTTTEKRRKEATTFSHCLVSKVFSSRSVLGGYLNFFLLFLRDWGEKLLREIQNCWGFAGITCRTHTITRKTKPIRQISSCIYCLSSMHRRMCTRIVRHGKKRSENERWEVALAILCCMRSTKRKRLLLHVTRVVGGREVGKILRVSLGLDLQLQGLLVFSFSDFWILCECISASFRELQARGVEFPAALRSSWCKLISICCTTI